ncbi:nitrate/nitrite transporter NrtS [Sphingobium sp. HBC34]|uniref:Nitrate/nitrite transporter NrtS n=1 Tax=Sphingobium cyanobacteriorum TaxID=3063954 RepID=A0ABT8ZSP3_9SPHN|nr:nitrate/nitrite transporter NrtS [Sphingobium sp. HBC34]MDO7837201.1 nitrate/nitrite transporter NrtS [Sphingobium sp. HBC34]
MLKEMINKAVAWNALRVSLFVGTCLNAINQGSAIWHGSGVEWGKVVLNYVVPYLVASYSAAKARRSMGV